MYYMSTTTATVRMPKATKRRLAAAARRRGLTLSRYLIAAGEQAATTPPSTGLGAELERLAIDAMAEIAVGRLRERQKRPWSEAEIVAEVKAARRNRRA